ncbi:MAG: glycosyltransferase family 2 protein [Anaerostipes sp.]|nr:glycosyltransferase family 2 protein [Anaerostipes sp.]
MEELIKVSIIVPVYNGEKYLRECIDSILTQSLKEMEVVIVNDGSQDNSLEICKSYVGDDRIKIINQKNLGTSIARKNGIKAAQGKYCMFSDQDDFFCKKDAFEKLYDEMEKKQLSILQYSYYSKFKFIKIHRKHLECSLEREELLKTRISDLFGSGGEITPTVWNKIYETKILKNAINNMNVSLKMTEDICLNLFAFTDENLKRVKLINFPCYCWREGIGYSSGSFLKYLDDYDELKKIQKSRIIELKLEDKILWTHHMESIYIMISYVKVQILGNRSANDIKHDIRLFLKCAFVESAIQYFETKKVWDEVEACYPRDSEAIYNYMFHVMENSSKNIKIKHKLKKLVRSLI